MIYLESDEEITSVIDKISKATSVDVALVIPRGGNLAQSIVNLKLLKKRASDLGKDVSLVTADKISRNLASQVGISVYSRVDEVGRRSVPPAPLMAERPVAIAEEVIKSDVPAPAPAKPAEELPEMPGIKIHRYYDERSQSPVISNQLSGESNTKSEPNLKTDNRKLTTENKSLEPSKDEVVEESVQKDVEKPIPAEVIELPEHPVIVESENPGVRKSEENPEIREEKLPEESGFKRKKISVRDAIKNSRESQDSPESQAMPAGRQVQSHEEEYSKSRINNSDESKPKLPGRRFKPMKKRRALFVLIALALAVILAFGYLILPQAKATVTFKAENFDQSSEAAISTAQKGTDADNVIITATQNSVDKEISDKFSATGQRNIGAKATGKVTLFNAGSSAPQKINSGQVLSYDSKNFTINAAVTIPGASVSGGNIVPGQVSADVTATDSGEVYNLALVKSPNKFVLNSFPSTQTWAESAAAFAGGSTQNVKVIQQSDINSAQEAIKTKLSAQAKEEVLKKVPTTEKYLDGTISENISALSSSALAGAQADDFTFSGKISTGILSFNENTLRDLLISKYEAKLDRNRVLVQKDKIVLDYLIKSLDMASGKAVYTIKMSGKISSRVDTERLKEQLSGKPLDEAKRVLSAIDLVKSVDLRMSPNLSVYKTMPLFKNSIKIETLYETE